MIGTRLAPRDRRALLLGGAVAAMSVGWSLGVRPLLRRAAELESALRHERALLAYETGIARAAPRYTAAFRTGAPRLMRAAPRLFGGGANGVAAAELARYIQEAARSSHVLVKRLDPATPGAAGEGLQRVPIQVSGESDLEGLLTFLYLLESEGKLVRLDDLAIRGLRAGESPAPAAPEALDFDLSAAGLALLPWRGPRPDSATGAEAPSDATGRAP